MKLRIKYNAPISLSFAIICTLILVCDQYLYPGIIQGIFTAEGNQTFQLDDFPAYLRLFTHVFGHSNWDHLVKNLTFILLLGPVLEERYGSLRVAFMILVTAFINGLLNALFFPTEVLGASGIVFMMILLTSFTNVKQGEIPLSFLAIVGLYLAKEIINSFQNDSISQISHIIGGISGAVYGILFHVIGPREKKNKKGTPPKEGA